MVAAPAASAVSAAPALAPCNVSGVGVGLIEVPKGSTDPRAQTYVIDHVRPGVSFARRFQVCNGTDRAVTVRLYANAATISGGAFRIVEGRASNELTGWISVSPAAVTIPARTRTVATARFQVPADVTAGERYAVLLAELPPQPGANGISVANRVGVRVYLDVGGPGVPKSDFRVDSLQASRDATGNPLVTAQVHNTGSRALDLSGALRLTAGPGGLAGGPFPAQLGTTLGPGQTAGVTVPLDKAIRGGPWTATLTLRSGLLERRARAQITFPDASGALAPPVRAQALPYAKDRKILIPVAAGLIGLLLLLLLVVGLITSRRKAKDKRQ